jgi:hypothetical protein
MTSFYFNKTAIIASLKCVIKAMGRGTIYDDFMEIQSHQGLKIT